MDVVFDSEVSEDSHVDEWRDWSGLPGHLLFDIADKFTDVADHVSFGSVCTSWQTIFLHNMKSIGSPLLLIDPPDDGDYFNRRALYSLSTKSVCNFQIQLPHRKICRGSSFGWLITMEEKGVDINHHIQLYNPFLSRTINLPTLDNIVQLFPDYGIGGVRGEYLRKAVLSSDPSLSDDYMVMGIVSRYWGLAFFKPGNECWTPIENSWSMCSSTSKRFMDVIYFQKARQFYGLLYKGAVLAIEFDGNEQEPKLSEVAPSVGSHQCDDCDHVYLIEDMSSGQLLQVHRIFAYTRKDENGKQQRLVQFLVFKFNPTKQRWTEIHNLGEKVVFAGNTGSVMRSASDCPGCLPNCIYYTAERLWASYNPKILYRPIFNGKYNLKDRTIEQHYVSTMTTKSLPATIWLEPTFTSQPQLGWSEN